MGSEVVWWSLWNILRFIAVHEINKIKIFLNILYPKKLIFPWDIIMTSCAIVTSDIHLVKMVLDYCASLLLQCQCAHCLEHQMWTKAHKKLESQQQIARVKLYRNRTNLPCVGSFELEQICILDSVVSTKPQNPICKWKIHNHLEYRLGHSPCTA